MYRKNYYSILRDLLILKLNYKMPVNKKRKKVTIPKRRYMSFGLDNREHLRGGFEESP